MAKILVVLTVKLEVPVLLIMAGLVPLILSEPTVRALFCKSSLALLVSPLIVRALVVLPNEPLPLKAKVPALIVVVPV